MVGYSRARERSPVRSPDCSILAREPVAGTILLWEGDSRASRVC